MTVDTIFFAILHTQQISSAPKVEGRLLNSIIGTHFIEKKKRRKKSKV